MDKHRANCKKIKMVLVREDELSSKRRDDLDKLRLRTNRLIKYKNDI